MALQLSLCVRLSNRITSLPIVPKCAISNQSRRLLSSLDAAVGDPSAGHRLIRKFVASSPKAVTLDALSYLLSSDIHRYSSLVLPMYERITETRWFNWNSKLVSEVVASLEKQERFDEAENLIFRSVEKLEFRERDVALFYCDLIESYSKQALSRGVFDSYSRLKQFLAGLSSSSCTVQRRAFESMINGLCRLDLPQDAEKMLEEMREAGFKPSAFEFRSILNGYGRLGLFVEMRRILDQMESSGHPFDTICSNIVLFSYGSHGDLSAMASWMQKMKNSDSRFSIRTYNSVLNSCPSISSMLQVLPISLPLSIGELLRKLPEDEALVVRELIEAPVLTESLQWSSSEAKIDLHGLHLNSAYVIMLQWVDELKSRFTSGDSDIPREIKVICGKGKHSKTRGESPLQSLVSELMARWTSPMRIDRMNVATFIAKGTNVKNWLLCLNQIQK